MYGVFKRVHYVNLGQLYSSAKQKFKYVIRCTSVNCFHLAYHSPAVELFPFPTCSSQRAPCTDSLDIATRVVRAYCSAEACSVTFSVGIIDAPLGAPTHISTTQPYGAMSQAPWYKLHCACTRNFLPFTPTRLYEAPVLASVFLSRKLPRKREATVDTDGS